MADLPDFLDKVMSTFGGKINGKRIQRVYVGPNLVRDSVTNRLTNPGFETPGAPVVVRTNRILNPSFEVDTAGWIPAVSTTVTRTTAQAHRGTGALQAVTQGANLGEGTYTSPGAGGAITAGTLFSASAWILAPAGAKMELLATCTGSGGTTAITRFDGTGAWQYVKAEGANPPSNLNPYVVIRTSTASGSAAQAITFFVDEAIMEYTPTIGLYFDGATSPILRSNLARDPAPSSASLWDAVGGAARTFANGEITVVCPGTAANEGVSTYTLAATSIEPAVSAGMWISAPAGTALYVETRANSQSSSGFARTSFSATGSWQFVKAEGASSTVSGGVHLVMVRTATAQAVTFKARQAIIQTSPTVGPYFDGYSAKAGYAYAWAANANASASVEMDADLSTRWVGQPNASLSELTGMSVAGWRAQDAALILSSRWSKTGAKSGRLIPTSASTNTYAEPSPYPASPAGPMTGAATIYLEKPLSGVLGSKTRRSSFYWVGGVADSPTLPNTAGEQETRLSATTGAANTRLVIWHGGAYGSGDMWIDLATLVDGTYTGPAFTGDFPGCAWDGTPHASTSQTWR